MRSPDRQPGLALRPLQEGFTIIEVLVTIMLLSIIVTLVLSQLTGLFGLSKRTGDQVTATNLAQGVLEQVKGEWQSQPKYVNACITATSLPDGVTTSVQDYVLSDNSSGSGTATTSGSPYSLNLAGSACDDDSSSTDNSAKFRKVAVTATVNGKATTLNVEIAHP